MGFDFGTDIDLCKRTFVRLLTIKLNFLTYHNQTRIFLISCSHKNKITMKTKLLILFLCLFSIVGFSQEKYKYREDIQSTDDKVKKVEALVQQEFGTPSSPGIWISNNSDYGLMIRTKGNTFSISAWQISDKSDIKAKVERLMAKVKPAL